MRCFGLNRYNIEFTTKAKNDIRRIVSYILNELKEPEIAKKYKELFIESMESLCELPNRGTPAKGKSPKGTTRRKQFIKSYIAFYLVDDAKRIVSIERVLYGASDWIKKF